MCLRGLGVFLGCGLSRSLVRLSGPQGLYRGHHQQNHVTFPTVDNFSVKAKMVKNCSEFSTRRTQWFDTLLVLKWVKVQLWSSDLHHQASACSCSASKSNVRVPRSGCTYSVRTCAKAVNWKKLRTQFQHKNTFSPAVKFLKQYVSSVADWLSMRFVRTQL